MQRFVDDRTGQHIGYLKIVRDRTEQHLAKAGPGRSTRASGHWSKARRR